MEREMYARHVIEKKLSSVFRGHLQRDYVSDLIDRYFQNVIDVAQLTLGVNHVDALNPSRAFLPVLNFLTPLILPTDQPRLTETIPSYDRTSRTEDVVLRRRSTEIEFGFQIRGGYDQNEQRLAAIYDNDDEELNNDFTGGFYIDHVAPNSIAWHTGRLSAGQRILSIDNMSLRRTTMSELLAYIDQRLCISLRVCHNTTSNGRIAPSIRNEPQPIQWEYEEKQYERSLLRPLKPHYQRPLSMVGSVYSRNEHEAVTTLCKMRDEPTIAKYYPTSVAYSSKEQRRHRQLQLLPIRVCILDTHGAPLGITVIGRSGRVDKGGGLFIADVEHESLADRAGLHAGDRILEINGNIVETVDSTLTDDWLTGKSVTLGFYERQFPKYARKERDRWSRRFCSFDEALDMLRTSRTLDLRITKS